MLRTSHVGSFPLDYSRENVEKITRDLYNIGLDVPPYPQMRSFIDIYLKPLADSGILTRHRDYYIINIDLDELDNVSLPKPSIPEAEIMVNFIRSRNIKFSGLRAPITGVFTLASKIYVSNKYIPDLKSTLLPRLEQVSDFLVKYLTLFIDYLVGLGFNIIFIDEPILGVIVGRKRILFGIREELIIDLFEKLLGKYNVDKGIHVCGRISSKLFEILTMIEELDYLNFEFHDTPQNIDTINPILLEKYDKFLAPGVVSSKKPVVEEVDEILDILYRLYHKIGSRIDLVSGDCGFAGLKGTLPDPDKLYNITISKLRNIVIAVNRFKNDLKTRV